MIGKCCRNNERSGKVRSESYYSFNLVEGFKSVTLSNIFMKYSFDLEWEIQTFVLSSWKSSKTVEKSSSWMIRDVKNEVEFSQTISTCRQKFRLPPSIIFIIIIFPRPKTYVLFRAFRSYSYSKFGEVQKCIFDFALMLDRGKLRISAGYLQCKRDIIRKT